MKTLTFILAFLSAIALGQANNSPNMSLPIPVVGQTSGPQWAADINASLTIIDQHNHSPGSGVQITPAGMNINTSLPFSNHSATNLQASVYTPQVSYTTDYGVHVEGVDLYYVDGNGNDIQMTTGGAVNATSSGISSGTATASFSAGVLVVNAASSTPANIQGGSVLLGNNVASSKYLTLAPPAAMASNITETLPAIPGAQSFLAMDSSGNITNYAAVSGGITGSMVASGTLTTSNISSSAAITGTQIAGSTITTTNIASGTIAVGNMASVSNNQNTGTAYSNGTNSFTSVVTENFASFSPSSRPILVSFSTNAIVFTDGGGGNSVMTCRLRNTTDSVTAADWEFTAQSAGQVIIVPAASFNWSGVVTGAHTTRTYALQCEVSNSGTLTSGGLTINIIQI